jgi:hypothetical protein
MEELARAKAQLWPGRSACSARLMFPSSSKICRSRPAIDASALPCAANRCPICVTIGQAQAVLNALVCRVVVEIASPCSAGCANSRSACPWRSVRAPTKTACSGATCTHAVKVEIRVPLTGRLDRFGVGLQHRALPSPCWECFCAACEAKICAGAYLNQASPDCPLNPVLKHGARPAYWSGVTCGSRLADAAASR